MHIHLNDENNLLLFIANGVTTVRNMAGDPFHLELREKIRKQERRDVRFHAGNVIHGGTAR